MNSASRVCTRILAQQSIFHRVTWKSFLPVISSAPLQNSCPNRKMSSKIGKIADRLHGTEKNVWVEFSALVREHKALNLGQGFPDFMPAPYLAEEFAKVCNSPNPLMWQYSRSFGHPRLVNAVAACYGEMMGRKVDPNNEVLISNGAYGCLFATIQGHINPGDEVIIIEPFFDCYKPMVKVAGGTPVFIPLRPSKSGMISSADWKLDPEELASKFTPKTKAIILNTPNNPLGKVFTREELEMVADLCKKNDVLCIADEVYEWLVYEGREHIKIATLPGMWERTITVGSAGKTFQATGMKLGWAVAPHSLMFGLHVQHQNSLYLLPTPAQEAVAICFEREQPNLRDKKNCYFHQVPTDLIPKRDRLANALNDMGMAPTVPEGGYFMLADISKFKSMNLPLDDSDDAFDARFIRWMTKEKKLSGIPPSVFYSPDHRSLGENFIRFCFIKEDSTLDKAIKILNEWGDSK